MHCDQCLDVLSKRCFFQQLFKNFTPTQLEELLLGANVDVKDVTRLQWRSSSDAKRGNKYNRC